MDSCLALEFHTIPANKAATSAQSYSQPVEQPTCKVHQGEQQILPIFTGMWGAGENIRLLKSCTRSDLIGEEKVCFPPTAAKAGQCSDQKPTIKTKSYRWPEASELPVVKPNKLFWLPPKLFVFVHRGQTEWEQYDTEGTLCWQMDTASTFSTPWSSAFTTQTIFSAN